MATYQTSYASALAQQADGTYLVLGTSESQSVATEGVADGVFRPGEEVTIVTDINTDTIQTTIEATYQDGYIIYADGGYVLFSNTPPPETFTADRDPDGTFPGLPVCFTEGTMIDTANGPVAIESLRIGDLVLCASGYRPVKWIGRRHYVLRSPRFTAAQREAIMPVRVKAHALADNVPSRDIVLSPWHHLYIDGMLVKANDVVNGCSVVREALLPRVTYFHIELDQFDVVRAHNVYSESWADGGNRDFFENVEVTTLRPADMRRRKAVRPGFTVLSSHDAALVEIKQRIAERAEPESGVASRMLAA